MALPTIQDYTNDMNRFTLDLIKDTDFLAVVDVVRREFAERGEDVNFFIVKSKMGNFQAVFQLHVGGPIMEPFSIVSSKSDNMKDAVVRDVKAANWKRFTPVAEAILDQFGGKFQVYHFYNADKVHDITVKPKATPYEPSAWAQAARTVSEFASPKIIPALIDLATKDETRQLLIDALAKHGSALESEALELSREHAGMKV